MFLLLDSVIVEHTKNPTKVKFYKIHNCKYLRQPFLDIFAPATYAVRTPERPFQQSRFPLASTVEEIVSET